MSAIAVRRAKVEDADAIGAVHVASWRVAYRDHAPEGWLEAQSAGEQGDAWRRRLAGSDRPPVFVAVDDAGDVVAFIGLALPSRDADAGPQTAEIATLYVDPSRWRIGAGSALMRASLDEFAALGFTTVTLWVLEDNPRARAFYTAAGFLPDGARQRPADWPDEIRLRRPIATPSPAAATGRTPTSA